MAVASSVLAERSCRGNGSSRAAAASRAGATMATTKGGGGVGGVGGGGRGFPLARADAARRGGVVVRAMMSLSSLSSSSSYRPGIGEAGGMMGTSFSATPVEADDVLIHCIIAGLGDVVVVVVVVVVAAAAAAARARPAPHEEEVRPCSGRRSERDDRRDRRRRNTAEYDNGPPSRDGGGRLPIVKVFNVGGYDGSVVTPSPRDHRAQPSAARYWKGRCISRGY
jgi:hypothetical protein